jgi:diguanylate cyclase (GGDEF)-like protein
MGERAGGRPRPFRNARPWGALGTGPLRRPAMLAAVAAVGSFFLLLASALSSSSQLSGALLQGAQAWSEAVAALACLLTARHAAGRARLTWGLFASGLFVWTLTDLGYSIATLAGVQVPEVSGFDAGWLLFYGPMLAGVVLLYGRLRPERGWQGVLDGSIIVLALAMLAWVTVLQPAVAASEGGATGIIVALAYPALDLLGGVALGWVVLRHRRQAPPWLWWIAGAFGLQMIAGVAYLMAEIHGLEAGALASAATYSAGAVLWCIAAATRMRRPRRAWSPGLLTTPPAWSRALPFGLAGVMLSAAFAIAGFPAIFALPLAACVLAAARLLETLRINQRLIGERDRLLVTDPLTGAYNRRFFEEEIERAFARCARGGETIALVAFDLDRFKEVNDRFGHGAGDDLLRAVAESGAQALRLGDVLCRLGGDEFVVIAPDADAQGALSIAERLLARVVAAAAEVVPEVAVSASSGVASFPADAAGPRDLLQRADEALYASKASGRGRATRYDSAARGERV